MKRKLICLVALGATFLIVADQLHARGPGGGGARGPTGGGAARGAVGGGNVGNRIGGGNVGNRIGGGNLGDRIGGGNLGDRIGGGNVGNRIGGGNLGDRIGGGNLGDRIGGGLQPGSRGVIGSGSGAFQGARDRLNIGDRPGLDRFDRRAGGLPGLENRQQWIGDHHQDLQNRLGQRGDFRQNWQQSRQDFMRDRRGDWLSWRDNRWDRHGDWYRGHWDHYWDGYWHRWWGWYPGAAGFALNIWSLNWIGYGFGLYDYYNPYWVAGPVLVYDYSRPAGDFIPIETAPTAGLAPTAGQAELTEFDNARQNFVQGDYGSALRWADEAVKKIPGDAVLHEFRALCQFAQRDYRGAAATLNAVLAVGPGWDWATMIGLYPDVEVYTKQLRALEQYVDDNPNAGDAHFVLAYQYLTTGAKDSAIKQFQEVVRLVPKDTVSRQLLEMLNPSTTTKTPPPAPSAGSVTADQLAGTWKASGEGGTRFELTLNSSGEFVWKYDHQGKQQVVKGAFAIDGDTLAMQPESGGVLLAQVKTLGKDSFEFKPIGSDQMSQTVKFTR